MVNEQLNALSNQLLSVAGPSIEPSAKAICEAIASASLDRTIAVVADGVRIDAAGRLPVPVSETVTFEELARQPHVAMTARLLIGVFDATRLITREHMEVVEQLFFTRPRGTYGFVFMEASRLKDAEDVERVLRTGWRLLVPEPKPRWLHQNLAERDVFLFDDRAADDSELPLDEARDGLQRLASADGAADDALARAALLYAIDLTLQSADGPDSAPSGDVFAEARRGEVARDELVSVRMRLIRRVDSEGVALQRVMETAVMRLRRDLTSGLEAAVSYRVALQKRAGLTRDFQKYLHTTLDRWLAASQGEIERRIAELERELVAIIRGADWQAVNRVIGREAAYPQPLLDALRRGVTPVKFTRAPGAAPQPPQRGWGLPHTGLAVLGSGIIYAITAVAGSIPAIIASVVLGAGGWAIYQEQGVREYTRHGQGVIHGVTEQMRLQVEEAIDAFVHSIHATVRNALQAAQDQLAAVRPDSTDRSPDTTRLRSLRDEIAAVGVTTPASA